MTRPILIGLALREDDAAPLALGRVLARLTDAPLALAVVVPYDEITPVATVDYARAIQQRAEKSLTDVADELRPEHDIRTYARQGSRAGRRSGGVLACGSLDGWRGLWAGGAP